MLRGSLNVANALTVSRLAATPFLCGAIVAHDTPLALGLLSYAAVTDVLDGYVARRFDQHTALGSYLDPLADKVLVTAGSVSLAVAGLLPLPLVALVLVRDATLMQGTAWHLYRTRVASVPTLEASWLSKANTLLQLGLFGSALLNVSSATSVLVPVVAATTWFSGVQYFLANPLKNVPSRPEISARQERLGELVNNAFVIVGLGLLLWCVYEPRLRSSNLEQAFL